jgi:hypothetical protein
VCTNTEKTDDCDESYECEAAGEMRLQLRDGEVALFTKACDPKLGRGEGGGGGRGGEKEDGY